LKKELTRIVRGKQGMNHEKLKSLLEGEDFSLDEEQIFKIISDNKIEKKEAASLNRKLIEKNFPKALMEIEKYLELLKEAYIKLNKKPGRSRQTPVSEGKKQTEGRGEACIGSTGNGGLGKNPIKHSAIEGNKELIKNTEDKSSSREGRSKSQNEGEQPQRNMNVDFIKKQFTKVQGYATNDIAELYQFWNKHYADSNKPFLRHSSLSTDK
jgi:hypothetical protein